MPRCRRGSSTFSYTFNSSMRLKLWNTNPIFPFLSCARWRSPITQIARETHDVQQDRLSASPPSLISIFPLLKAVVWTSSLTYFFTFQNKYFFDFPEDRSIWGKSARRSRILYGNLCQNVVQQVKILTNQRLFGTDTTILLQFGVTQNDLIGL